MEEANALESSIDLREYLRILLKRKWTIVLVFVLVVAAVTVVTLRQPKIYSAKTVVLIDRETPSVLGQVKEVVSLGERGYWGQLQYLNTQKKVIRSRHIARKVVEALNLETDPDFSGPDPAGSLIGLLDVQEVKDSRLIEILVEHQKPEKAQKLANTVARAYIEANLERKVQATESATEWLAKQLDKMKQKVTDSEMDLYEFKQKHNVVTTSIEDKATMISKKLDAVSEELTGAEAKRRALEVRHEQLDSLSAAGNVPALVQALKSPLLDKLRENEAELEKERKKLLEKYKERWPAVQEIDAQLKQVRTSLLREIQDILLSVRSDLDAARENETRIRRSLQGTKGEALGLSKHEIEYSRLKREADNYQRLYKILLQRHKESDLTKLLHSNNIAVLDRAELPRAPIKPRVHLNILLACVIGLLGGIGLAFFLEFLDNTVKTQDDVERVVGLPFLGLLPTAREGERAGKKGLAPKVDLYAHEHPKSSMAECARSIRTNVLFTTGGKASLKLLVTSAGPQEGKTTTASTLATTMASSGSRTLLIDTDMRRPRVHKVFGMEAEQGLSTVIVGETDLDQAIQASAVPSLDVLPCGPVPPNPAELLGSPRFLEIVEALAQRYDRLVFDSPPVVAVTDSMVLAGQVDGVVLVLKSGRTTRELAKQAKKQLDDVGAKLLGCVMNDVDLDAREYGYYHYYYYHKYGYYYGERDKSEAKSEAEAG